MQGQNQTRWHALHNQWRSALSGVAALSCWTPYWTFTVSGVVSSNVSRDVSGNLHRARGPAGLSASARQPGRRPKAIVLLQANETGCLWALANLSASFSCNSPGLSQRPVAGAHGRPAGYGKKNQVRAYWEWPPRSRPKPFPMLPAAPSAPDHRPIRSHPLPHHQAGGQARFARDEAPHRSRLGTLSPLSLLGTRECFCRNQLTQRWGASFALLRLGGRRIAALRSLGRPARVPGWGQDDACQRPKSAWFLYSQPHFFCRPSLSAMAGGLRALAANESWLGSHPFCQQVQTSYPEKESQCRHY